MPNRRHPFTIAARVDHAEKALLEAAARVEGGTINDLVRAAVIPLARERLGAALQEFETCPDEPHDGDDPRQGVGEAHVR